MRAEVLDSRIGVEYTSLSHPRLDLYAYRYYLATLFDISLHSSLRRDPMSLPASTVHGAVL